MKTYPLFKVHVNAEEVLSNMRTVLDSGYINEGSQVTELEVRLGERLGASNIVLTNSCTSALTLALHLAGVGPGDEVITTPMTCVASNTPIINLGGKVVWADIDPKHGMIDPYDVMAKITPETKAVMAVAWAGTPPNLFMLQKLCKAMDLKLILDAAHAFDARYEGKPAHEWADYTCYSFQAIKHFTTGDGGALVCKDRLDWKRSRTLKWFGLDRDAAKDEKGDWKGQQWDADILEAGYKFNMNNVTAAIGLANLNHVDHIMGKHRTNAAIYDQWFKNCKTVRPLDRPIGGESSHWVYTVKVVPGWSSMQRDELLKALNEEGIMAGVVHVPNDVYSCFGGSAVELPGVREFASVQFSLPCGWWLDENDINHIAARVKELTR